MSLTDLIQNAKLRENKEGTKVRTKEVGPNFLKEATFHVERLSSKIFENKGLIYIEKKGADGSLQKTSPDMKVVKVAISNLYTFFKYLSFCQEFVPIEAAHDPKVCQITDFLFLGSQDAAANLDGLKANNIRNILNVATGITNAYPKLFNYYNVEILDLPESPLIEKMEICFGVIDKIKHQNESVLVHW